MLYLYLDESGDLGFDFFTKKPSKYFVITILCVNGQRENRLLINSVKKTMARKLNPRNKSGRTISELKGYGTSLEVKKYFYEKIKILDLKIFTLILDKKKILSRSDLKKDRIYNYAAHRVLSRVEFEKIQNVTIELIVDKSKTKPEIRDFNIYIREQLQGRINPKIPLNIYHWDSQKNYGLQACDIFCWGIFQRYEYQKQEWYNVFKEKVVFEEMVLP